MSYRPALFLSSMENELLKAIYLGIIQGLTEFLPVSSSGHLVIGAKLLGFNDPGIGFEIFLHLGTLIAVIIAFYRELRQMVEALFSSPAQRRADPELKRAFMWNIYVIVATIPAVFASLFLKEYIEQIFNTILITFVMLIVTGTIMLLTTRLKEKETPVNCPRSFLIGIAQAAAILPGLSRSGSTIFTGMLLGINRETAARFSFIMSIPAILGAAVLKLGDFITTPPSSGEMVQLFAGTLASVISGYFAIILLMGIVRRGRLHWFGYYCYFVSGLGLLWYFLH